MSARAVQTPSRSAYRAAGVGILLATGLIGVLIALVIGGGAAPLLLQDPGPFVRWATPIVKLVMNIAAAAMLGSLVLALFALRSEEKSFDTALNTASAGAAVFTVTAGISGFFTFMAVSYTHLTLPTKA